MSSRRQRPFPIWSLVVMTGAAALALSGCVIIKSDSSAQLDGIGAVQVTSTFCASDTNSDNAGYSPPDPACQGASRGGNSGFDAVNQSTQLLIAYRIPTSATAPDSITTAQPGGASSFTFSQSSSYTSALQSLSPAPGGQKWVGYISTTQSYTTAGNQYLTVTPRFTLQRGPDGSPFQGPFAYRVVVGERVVDGTRPLSRPVTCGSAITAFNIPDGSICADAPSTAAIATNLQQSTQDLGILDAPAAESVSQGNVARVNFNAVYAGDGGPAPTFTVGAATNVPDAIAGPSTPTLTPVGGSNPLRVIFRVPIDTEPGPYDVTLAASLSNGQTRASTHELQVTPTKVRCTANAPTIAGTRKDDVLRGTPRRDVIAGYAGNDVIYGLEGNDLICAGKGDDEVRGGNGNDRIAGRRGNDLLLGGRGRNVIQPGPGKDRFIQ